MKYIDADHLRAEIEIKKKTEGWCEVGKDTADIYYARGVRFTCDFVLNLIDSLQPEQPEVDLKKEINDYWEKICNDEFGELIPRVKETTWFDDIARHFYELGRNARKEDK